MRVIDLDSLSCMLLGVTPAAPRASVLDGVTMIGVSRIF